MEKTFYPNCPSCGNWNCVDFEVGTEKGYNEKSVNVICDVCEVDFIAEIEVRILINSKLK